MPASAILGSPPVILRERSDPSVILRERSDPSVILRERSDPSVILRERSESQDPAPGPALHGSCNSDDGVSARGDGGSIGVGPWHGPRPDDARYDPDLLAHGDRRNVADEFRYWTVDAIRAELDARRDPGRELHVAIENWAHDLNIGSVVRTANAFNVAGVHIVGRRRWNRRGAMVTEKYLHLHHHDDAAALATWAAGEGLTLVGVDNVPGSVPLEHRPLPARCVLLFGQESTGLTAQAQAASDVVVHITQRGSTRSLNAGAAGAIAMFAWALQHQGGTSG